MDKTFEEKIIDEFVKLHLRIHYPKVIKFKYESGQDGTYKRLQDEIKIEYLKKIVRLNTGWDITKMSEEVAKRVNEKIRN